MVEGPEFRNTSSQLWACVGHTVTKPEKRAYARDLGIKPSGEGVGNLKIYEGPVRGPEPSLGFSSGRSTNTHIGTSQNGP